MGGGETYFFIYLCAHRHRDTLFCSSRNWKAERLEREWQQRQREATMMQGSRSS